MLVVALALISGCGGARFRASCEAVAPGEPLADVKRALQAAGGRYSLKVPDRNQHWWTRPKLFFKIRICAVDFDRADRAVSARYWEGDDLL